MPRKADAPTAPTRDWYLREWMAALKVNQSELARRAGWSKPATNSIFHGRTNYYRQILNEAAEALHVEPYELLMHPDDATALRQLKSAIRVVDQSPRIHGLDDDPAGGRGR